MKKLVGVFSEKDFKNGIDKLETEKAKKSTGLHYTNTEIIKKNGNMFLKVWVCDKDTFVL